MRGHEAQWGVFWDLRAERGLWGLAGGTRGLCRGDVMETNAAFLCQPVDTLLVMMMMMLMLVMLWSWAIMMMHF